MADLQIRNQYQSLEHGDVKLYVFPTKSQAKLYKIVLDTAETDAFDTVKMINKHAMNDMSFLIQMFYNQLVTDAFKAEYGLEGLNHNDIWARIEVVLNQLSSARNRLVGAQLMVIRIEKAMFPYLIGIAQFAPIVFKGTVTDKFFQVLKKAEEALQKEQL